MRIRNAVRFVLLRPEILIIISIFLFHVNTRLWEKPGRVIFLDVFSYYGYLPVTFINKSISSEKHPDIRGTVSIRTSHGENYIFKTTCGLSLLNSPFFLVTHSILSNQNIQHTGFEAIFKIALLLSSLCWLWLGLYFLRRTLQQYFNYKVTALTLIVLFTGTNLAYYSTVDATMSHQFSFVLFSVFIWLVLKWFERPTIRLSFIAGIILGLISLVRPSNVIIVVFPLLYHVYNLSDFQKRLQFFKERAALLAIIVFCAVLVWIPQMLYWHKYTGHCFFWSYTNEGFYFNQPQIINGLFSFRKGWFLYTPSVLLAISGIFLLKKQLRVFFYPLLIFVILNTYVVFSWWCWWYGSSFGQRAMVESYALLAIPLAAFINYLGKSINYKRIILAGLLVLSMFIGIFHTIKYYHGSIHDDSMTKEAYLKYFFHVRPDAYFYKLLDRPDYKNK